MIRDATAPANVQLTSTVQIFIYSFILWDLPDLENLKHASSPYMATWKAAHELPGCPRTVVWLILNVGVVNVEIQKIKAAAWGDGGHGQLTPCEAHEDMHMCDISGNEARWTLHTRVYDLLQWGGGLNRKSALSYGTF